MRSYSKETRLHEKLTLKIVIVSVIALIVTVMSILLVSVIESNQNFTAQLDQHLNKIVVLQSRVEEMDQIYSALSNYVVSGGESYLKEYTIVSQDFELFITKGHMQKKGSKGYYLYVDLEHMYESFIEQANKIKAMYESGVEVLYVNDQIFELSKNNIFVKDQLAEIISFELGQVEDKYGDIELAIEKRQEVVYLIILLVIVVTLMVGIFLANKLTYPIYHLSLELKQIGRGNYDPKPLEVKGIGEMASIIRGFNKMKSRLSENIELIHENARIKEKLKNQEIDLLESENHLKQSQLDFLQSQINPHFLYNTLNSIQILADVEEAPQTEKMLEHLGKLMRYNVKKTNTVVRLGEELDVINNYVHIQLIRFGDKISYQVNCNSEILEIQVPSMILQPLVENAMIHGLEPKMGQGELRISGVVRDGFLLLSVRDNGLGMTQETMDSLLTYGADDGAEGMSKNIRSIGVANVIRRCRLYYGYNVVQIQSKVGEFTEFTFKIAMEKTK